MATTGEWKRPESVLVLVHSDDGQVLLLQRADDVSFWQSVTGSLEADESPVEAAVREVREETGIDTAVVDTGVHCSFEIREPWRARYAPGVTRNLERVFTACVPAICEISLSPTEHLAYRWLAPRDALALATSPTNRSAIRRLFKLESDPASVSNAGAMSDGVDDEHRSEHEPS